MKKSNVPGKRNTDLTKVLKSEHQDKWVALSQNQDMVLDYDAKLADLVKKMEGSSQKPVYMKVLPFDVQFAF